MRKKIFSYPTTRLSETLVPIISWDLLNIVNMSDELVEDYFCHERSLLSKSLIFWHLITFSMILQVRSRELVRLS